MIRNTYFSHRAAGGGEGVFKTKGIGSETKEEKMSDFSKGSNLEVTPPKIYNKNKNKQQTNSSLFSAIDRPDIRNESSESR